MCMTLNRYQKLKRKLVHSFERFKVRKRYGHMGLQISQDLDYPTLQSIITSQQLISMQTSKVGAGSRLFFPTIGLKKYSDYMNSFPRFILESMNTYRTLYRSPTVRIFVPTARPTRLSNFASEGFKFPLDCITWLVRLSGELSADGHSQSTARRDSRRGAAT